MLRLQSVCGLAKASSRATKPNPRDAFVVASSMMEARATVPNVPALLGQHVVGPRLWQWQRQQPFWVEATSSLGCLSVLGRRGGGAPEPSASKRLRCGLCGLAAHHLCSASGCLCCTPPRSVAAAIVSSCRRPGDQCGGRDASLINACAARSKLAGSPALPEAATCSPVF